MKLGIPVYQGEALKLIASLFGDEAAKDVQVTAQYLPQPPVMGEIPPAPACFVRW